VSRPSRKKRKTKIDTLAERLKARGCKPMANPPTGVAIMGNAIPQLERRNEANRSEAHHTQPYDTIGHGLYFELVPDEMTAIAGMGRLRGRMREFWARRGH
jgi:hypothetical protein